MNKTKEDLNALKWDDSDQSDPEDFSTCHQRELTVLDNGAKYTGQWKQNMRHGYGTQEWKDGATYTGYWKNDKAHGHGVFHHVSGDRYEGHWKQDKAHGQGKFTHMNGSTYNGLWKHDH